MLSSLISSVLVVFLTIFSYFFTKIPQTAPIRTQVIFISLFSLLFFIYFTDKKETKGSETKISTMLLTIFVLTLVGTTGWFLSSFAFMLYFLLLVYSFVFTPFVSVSFIFALVYIMLQTFGRTYEEVSRIFFILISFLASIPITFYLREKFLSMQEVSKDILILKKKEGSFLGKLDEILENRISLFAALIRQPIADIRHLSFRLQDSIEENKKQDIYQKIIALSNQALTILKRFEEEATGKKLVSAKENNSLASPPADPASHQI